MNNEKQAVKKSVAWQAWLVSVCGWLVCATFCLLLTVALESWPDAYDTVFPAVLLMLFGNIFIFLFVTTRHGINTRRLAASVLKVCAGEGLLLAALYLFGRFAIAA